MNFFLCISSLELLKKSIFFVHAIIGSYIANSGGVPMCTRRCDRVMRLQNRIVENIFQKYYNGNVNVYKSMKILKFADID